MLEEIAILYAEPKKNKKRPKITREIKRLPNQQPTGQNCQNQVSSQKPIASIPDILVDDSFVTVQLEPDMPPPQMPPTKSQPAINKMAFRRQAPANPKPPDSKYLLPMSVIETYTNGGITSFLLSEYKNSSCFMGGHITRDISSVDNPFMAFTLAKKAANMFDSRIGISTV